MPSNGTTALLPAGLYAGDIPNLSLEDQAIIGFFSALTNERTKSLYRTSLKLYIDWCREQHLSLLEARPVHLRLYLSWLQLQPQWAESTKARLFGVVAVFYRRALIDELILRDPTLGIERIEVDKTKQRRTWLTPLDMARYLEAAQKIGIQEYAMICILGQVALRAAEACSLTIENLQNVGGQDLIRFIGKGAKAAVMPLPPSVSQAVRTAIGHRTHGPIILNTEGNAYNPNSLWRLTKRIATAAGIDPDRVSPHTMRRTFAKTARDLGVPTYHVQDVLRHADLKTTMLYIGGERGMNGIASMQVASFYTSMTG